jgi:hypothetical protein
MPSGAGRATLCRDRREVIDVPAVMLTKNEPRAPRPTPVARATMYLSRRDVVGTMVTALIVLLYVANVQEWWYLGSNRWAAVTMLVAGFAGCPLAARVEGEKLSSTPIVLLALLGAAALALGVIAIVTGAQWALLALTLVVVVLWVGTTLRHAVTPPARPLATR